MAYDIGDRPVLRYTVRDPVTGALTDATVTVTVTKPDGTAVSPVPTVVRTDTGQYYAAPTVDVPGDWDWLFQSSGAVVDQAQGSLYVRSANSAVPWRPSLREVADLVPNRTVSQSAAAGDPVLAGVFTAATSPTDDQVDRYVDQAVAEIGGQTGVVDPALYEMARSCATMRAAAKVQTALPEDEGGGSGTRAADRWQAQSDGCVKALVAANAAKGGAAGQAGVLSDYAFPDPEPWGDLLELW